MNYRYFEDLHGNQYRWTIKPESDGKYYGTIYKVTNKGSWAWFNKGKERSFKLRRMAKSWCLKHASEATQRQRTVLKNRADRKIEREAQKPVYTKTELKLQKLKKDFTRLNKNIMKNKTKIKSLTTRNTNYGKQLNKVAKQMEKLK